MKPTLLIVDDISELRDQIREALEGDFEIIGEVSNGQAAVDFCAKRQPEMITMDISMPEMNGLEATRIICKTYFPPPKIVMVSSLAKPEFIKRAHDNGACDFVAKPFDPTDLRKVLLSVYRRDRD